MQFIYVLPHIFYALLVGFTINLPSGSGEQTVVCIVTFLACTLTTVLAVRTYLRRGG